MDDRLYNGQLTGDWGIGVGAHSTLGARHFARKWAYTYKKLTKFRNNHDICPKNIFHEFGEGQIPPPFRLLRLWIEGNVGGCFYELLRLCPNPSRPAQYSLNKLSYCWETVRRESMPMIAEMDVEMTT